MGGAGLEDVGGGGGGGGGGGIDGILAVGGSGGAGGGARGKLLMDGGGGGGAGGCPLNFLPAGGGGGGFPNAMALKAGFGAGLGGGFLASGLGTAGAESIECGVGLRALNLGIEGANALGSGGAAEGGGGLGAEGRLVSESEYEVCSPSAPVLTPPLVFFSFGMPPAKSPPNCGADSIVLDEPPPPPPVSLLLRFLLPLGVGGASPVGGRIPGTGGAPLIGPAPESGFLSSRGVDLSFVTVDFSLAPLLISDSSAPCSTMSASLSTTFVLYNHARSDLFQETYSAFGSRCWWSCWQSATSRHRRWWRRSSEPWHWGRWRRRWWCTHIRICLSFQV